MSTYLVLCQDMARDVGIPGTGPSAVDASTLSEEETSVVRYVAQADLDIQSRWFDWDFLWSEATITVTTATSTLVSGDTGFPNARTRSWNRPWLERSACAHGWDHGRARPPSRTPGSSGRT